MLHSLDSKTRKSTEDVSLEVSLKSGLREVQTSSIAKVSSLSTILIFNVFHLSNIGFSSISSMLPIGRHTLIVLLALCEWNIARCIFFTHSCALVTLSALKRIVRCDVVILNARPDPSSLASSKWADRADLKSTVPCGKYRSDADL